MRQRLEQVRENLRQREARFCTQFAISRPPFPGYSPSICPSESFPRNEYHHHLSVQDQPHHSKSNPILVPSGNEKTHNELCDDPHSYVKSWTGVTTEQEENVPSLTLSYSLPNTALINPPGSIENRCATNVSTNCKLPPAAYFSHAPLVLDETQSTGKIYIE